MSVQLVALDMIYGGWKFHPTYNNFIIQHHHVCDHATREARIHMINHLLTPYNGRIILFNSNQVTLEFDSQEDLIHFVLTWS